MQLISATFNTLEGIQSYSTYSNGLLKECTLNEYNQVETAYGVLVRLGDNMKDEYCIDEHDFIIKHIPELLNQKCGDCENCKACG